MKPSEMSTLDRLRSNVPVTRSEYQQRNSKLAAWGGGTLIIVAALIIVCTIGGCHPAHGAEPQMEAFRRRYDQPAIVQLAMFSTPGCTACANAANDAKAGRLIGVDLVQVYYNAPQKRWTDPARWEQFGNSFPHDDAAFQRASQSGMLEFNVLPTKTADLSYPIFWFPGSSTYRVGYESSASHELTNWAMREAKAFTERSTSQPIPQPQPQLNASVNGVVPFGDGGQAGFQMQMNQATYQQQLQGQTPQGYQPQVVMKAEDFDGVSVVLVVGDLTKILDVPFVKQFVLNAANGLREKLHTAISDKIRVKVIAKQFDPESYDRVIALTVDPPDPFRLYALIPQRSKGIKGFIVEKIKSAIADHVEAKLQNLHIHPLLEKESASMFEGIQDIAFAPKPSTPPKPSDPWGPHRDQVAWGGPIAWLVKECKFYKRIRGLLGYQVT